MTEQIEHASPKGNLALAFTAAVADLVVPGLGHLLLRKWGKALVYLLAVGMLAVVGLWMRGNVFTFSGDDVFDRLGFCAELGSGIFYFLAHSINPSGADIAHAAGDYGTRLFATAGVLNILCALEAFQIGMGRESERHSSV